MAQDARKRKRLSDTLLRRGNLIGLDGWLAGKQWCVDGDAGSKAVLGSSMPVIITAGQERDREKTSRGSCQTFVDSCWFGILT